MWHWGNPKRIISLLQVFRMPHELSKFATVPSWELCFPCVIEEPPSRNLGYKPQSLTPNLVNPNVDPSLVNPPSLIGIITGILVPRPLGGGLLTMGLWQDESFPSHHEPPHFHYSHILYTYFLKRVGRFTKP